MKYEERMYQPTVAIIAGTRPGLLLHNDLDAGSIIDSRF